MIPCHKAFTEKISIFPVSISFIPCKKDYTCSVFLLNFHTAVVSFNASGISLPGLCFTGFVLRICV